MSTKSTSETNSNRGSRRRRHSSSSKSNSGTKSSKIVGIGLIVFGAGMCLWSFDLFSSVLDILQLWPVLIVLLGFWFVIKDYLKESSTSNWNSKQ